MSRALTFRFRLSAAMHISIQVHNRIFLGATNPAKIEIYFNDVVRIEHFALYRETNAFGSQSRFR